MQQPLPAQLKKDFEDFSLSSNPKAIFFSKGAPFWGQAKSNHFF